MESKYKVNLQLASGFQIEVAPLSPYYMDFLDLVHPFKELPRRQIQLAAGDTYDIDFKPAENHVYASDDPDYELYIRYIAAEAYNRDLERLRASVRNDYLLSTCIEIVDGPFTQDGVEWRQRMEAAFEAKGWRVPRHEGAVRLIFIKSIIRLQSEKDAVIQAALLQEVSEHELAHALNMFQS